MTATEFTKSGPFGLEHDVVDEAALERTAARFREAGIVLPTFAQLADPGLAPAGIRESWPPSVRTTRTR